MDTVLGLFGILIWIVGVIGLAAGITYAVIRLTPSEKPKEPPAEPAS
ncbi:MAG TPA: hypothetical protein VGJ34_12485 [Gaiellaceae bacterium]|jgi:hypothetical protein